MIKLADYFVIVGYESSDEAAATAKNTDADSSEAAATYNNSRSAASSSLTAGRAKIIQRFPLGSANTGGDADQDEFDANVHCFCQPHQGWRLYARPEPPTFFVSVLTDVRGRRRYCACLTFLEPYNYLQKHGNGYNEHEYEEDDDDNDEDDEEDDDDDEEVTSSSNSHSDSGDNDFEDDDDDYDEDNYNDYNDKKNTIGANSIEFEIDANGQLPNKNTG
jgi:hypothetical protein